MKKESYPQISIVIVVYKKDKYLPKLLSSIKQLEYPKTSLEIIIVWILAPDKDISFQQLQVKIIPIAHRVGYAKAVNTGIAQCSGEYLFLPNPDTYIEKSAVLKIVTYLKEHD